MEAYWLNSEGEECPVNVNHGVVIRSEGLEAKITRLGQQEASEGNKVRVRLQVKVVSKKIVGFREPIFGKNLDACVTAGAILYKDYLNDTWRDAIREAYDYAMEQISAYEELLMRRHKALARAEM